MTDATRRKRVALARDRRARWQRANRLSLERWKLDRLTNPGLTDEQRAQLAQRVQIADDIMVIGRGGYPRCDHYDGTIRRPDGRRFQIQVSAELARHAVIWTSPDTWNRPTGQTPQPGEPPPDDRQTRQPGEPPPY